VILPALVEYYDRLEADPESTVPAYGWSVQKIGFVVVLNDDGSLHAIEPPPGSDVDSKKHFSLIVPGQSKPSGSGINPCFLWDNATYMLAQLPEDRKDAAWAWERFQAFKARHLALEAQIKDAAFSAICLFLRSWTPESVEQNQGELEKVSGFGVFRLRSAREYGHQSSAVTKYWNGLIDAHAFEGVSIPSLLTGLAKPPAILHEPKIKGVRGGQTSGTLIVSFNKDAFESYGKNKGQGRNSPVGITEAFRYCTSLNHLLGDAGHRSFVGDTTVVFWTAKPHPIESITGHMIGGVEDPATLRQLEAFLKSVRSGAPSDSQPAPETPFYILGLAPNASRLSVRFWHSGTVAAFAKRLADHARALDLSGAPDGYTFPSIRSIARETAVLKNGWPDEDRVPPRLSGELARSILTGAPYPRPLLSGVIQRIRAEGFVDASKRKGCKAAMHLRASILKACLTRDSTPNQHKVPMSLNKEHPAAAYQLGRLFAVLEKTQEDAYGGKLNSTIRSKYIGTASSTPSTVFPRILRLHTHHLAKIEHPGRRVNLEKLIGEIFSHIDSAAFPAHLPIEAQGLFFLGYYQQRQDLFTKKPSAEASPATA